MELQYQYEKENIENNISISVGFIYKIYFFKSTASPSAI